MILKQLKVLFIHHSGVFGGASRSLLELITSFNDDSIDPIVVIPKGTASEAFNKQNIVTIEVNGLSQFDNTSYGHYRGFRLLIILREILLLPSTYFALRKAKKITQGTVDLIHINEVTNLPSVILASKIFKKPIILHVRSLQRSTEGIRNKIIYKLIDKYVSSIIAIDETVARSLPTYLAVKVIHNGFDPASKINDKSDSVRDEITILPGKLKVMMVGNLLFMKGIEEFMKAAKLCKDNNLSVDFILVGDKPNASKSIIGAIQKILGISHDAKKFVTDYIQQNHLEETVHLIRFTSNITSAYENCDILCFPSHLNAVGRPVFEAAFFKKPSIVAIRNPEKDTVVHMGTGLCIDEKDAVGLFNAIEYFYNNKDEVVRMGNEAFKLANENFNVKNNANKVIQLYNDILRST